MVAIHNQEKCWLRDLNFGAARVWILCHYLKLLSPHGQRIPLEELGLFDPYLRVTRRLARYIVDLWPHRYGILNRCQYPINTGGLEGLNNKIKVIKRKAYGFHDLGYFSPKIIRAFTN